MWWSPSEEARNALELTADGQLCRRADDVLKGEAERCQRMDKAEQAIHHGIQGTKGPCGTIG